MTDIRSNLARQGLIRPRDGRVLGGVCAGLGASVRPYPVGLATAVCPAADGRAGQPATDLPGAVDSDAGRGDLDPWRALSSNL
jgi:hypothetical protein